VPWENLTGFAGAQNVSNIGAARQGGLGMVSAGLFLG
jgi:hypothetical protein